MRIAVGSDHAGYAVKEAIAQRLRDGGHEVVDHGCDSDASVDYPDFAADVARSVASGACERGIMLDADGIGAAMVCNKQRGIRAALCYDMRTIVNSREHANANVLTLGGPLHGGGELCEMAKLWLELRFPGGERWAGVNRIMATERGR